MDHAPMLSISKPPESPAFNAVLAACVAGIGPLVFGFSLGFTSPVLTAMEVLKDDTVFTDSTLEQLEDGSTWVVNSNQAALFSAIVNIGAMAGSLMGGVLVDKLGRQRTICLAGIPFTLSWVWTALVSEFTQLLVARFCVGLTVGVVSMAVPLYIGEVAPTHLRGALGAVNQFAVTIGILTAYVVGIFVETNQATAIHCTNDDDGSASLRLHGDTPHESGTCQDIVGAWRCKEDSSSGYVCHGDLPAWRVLCWVAAGFSALLFAAMLFMPETPTYLFEKRRMEECQRSLLFLRGGCEAAVAHEMQEMEKEADTQKRLSPQKCVSSDASGPASRNPLSAQQGLMDGGGGYGDGGDNDDDGDDIRKTDPGGGSSDGTTHSSASARRRSSANGRSGDLVQTSGTATHLCSVLCAPDVRPPLVMGVSIMLCQQFSGINAVIFYSGSILQTAGLDNANVGGAFVMLAQVVFTGVSIALMDRAGRRPLLTLSAVGMALSGLALAAFFFNHKKPAWLALASLLLYIAFFSLGLGPVPWLFMGEIFPAHAKAPAASIATVVNWSTSFVISFLFPVAQSLLQPQGTFLAFSAFCVVAALFGVFVMPETKGKTFDEIALWFKGASSR